MHSTSEEMLPWIWTVCAVAGSKCSSTHFHLHHICSAMCTCYVISKDAASLMRGLQLPMRERNKSADIWPSIDLLGKEIRFSPSWTQSPWELAYTFYIESDVRTFELSPWHRVFHFPPSLPLKTSLLNKTKYTNYFALVLFWEMLYFSHLAFEPLTKPGFCWFNVIWVRISPA